MAEVLEQFGEADLNHVTLVSNSAGTCLRGHLRRSARAVALKLLNTDRCLLQMQNALAHSGVCVERVLQPVGVFRSRFLNGLLWDWMPEGSLHSLLYESHLYPDLPLVLRFQILLDVAEGLNLLHSVSLPHGGLKPTNILLDHQYRAKLCDWGQRTQADVRTRVSNVTAPCFRDLAFLAPEVVLGNAPCVKCDMFSFGVLMWETLNRRPACEGMDHLLNLVTCAREKATENNLLPPETPQSHNVTQLMTRCWSVDPKQRPLAEECVLVLRKVMETQGSGAHCTAVKQIKSSKERALLNCKHTPKWELPIELNNLEGYSESKVQSPKQLRSKNIPVTVPHSHQHAAQTRETNETSRSPPFSTPTQACCRAPPKACCRGVSHSPVGLSSSNLGVRHCDEFWGINKTRASPPVNTPCSSPMSPTHAPLHSADQRTAVCPVSSGWTCCRLLQERREAIVKFMTEGRLNNLLDVLRARRAVTREDYELIMAAMTLSARTRCLLDKCACLGENVAVLVATTLGLVSIEASNGHARSRLSPKGQAG